MFSCASKFASRGGAHGANIVLEEQPVHNDMKLMHIQALVQKSTSMTVESGEQVGQSIAGTCQMPECTYYIFSQL